MNFEAAKRLADENAKSFVIEGKEKCPLLGTGLIVCVVREDDQETLPNAVVDASGKKATTEASGLAKFLPLPPETYAVGVASFDDPDGVLKAPAAVEKAIAEHTCPVHPIEVAVYGRPSLELRWKHDGEAVHGASVKLGGATYDLGTTAESGVAAWKGPEPIKPAKYATAVEIDGVACQLFTEDGGTEIKPPEVDVPKGKRTLKLKVRRPSWVKLVVQRPKGTDTEEVADAEFEITWPDDKSTKPFKTKTEDSSTLAHVKDIASGAAPRTCDVLSLTMPDDGEVYEVAAVTTT